MNSLQRTVKVIATGFAWFLAIVIIVGIVSAGIAVINVLSNKGDNRSETFYFQEYKDDIKKIQVENGIYNLEVMEGDEFLVEFKNVNENTTTKVKDDTLHVEQTGSIFNTSIINLNFLGIGENKSGKIIIQVPKGFQFEEFKLDAGMGNITLNGIIASTFKVNGGVGNIQCNYITSDKVSIDCGAGNLSLDDVYFKNTDINGGVGNIDLFGVLKGNMKIDCGIGNILLNIDGYEEDYKLKIDQGIGRVKVNGEKVSSEYINNENSNNYFIDIDGGIGNVDIDFIAGIDH